MSLDYTLDYSNHVLLDSKNRYKDLYKLYKTEAENISRGDLVLVKTPCGKYGIFVAIDDTGEDGALHLTQYSELEFVKAPDPNDPMHSVISDSNSCCDRYDSETGTCDCGGNDCHCADSSSSCGCGSSTSCSCGKHKVCSCNDVGSCTCRHDDTSLYDYELGHCCTCQP